MRNLWDGFVLRVEKHPSSLSLEKKGEGGCLHSLRSVDMTVAWCKGGESILEAGGFAAASKILSKKMPPVNFFAGYFQPGWKRQIAFFHASNPVGNTQSFFFILPTQLETPNHFFSCFQPGWKHQIIFFHAPNPVGKAKSVFFMLPTRLERSNRFFSDFQPGWKG
jgi:hypothetical protein